MTAASKRSTPLPAAARWLVLFHQLRPKPDYLRVKIGRQLRALGAVAIKNSVYVLPATETARRGLTVVVAEIRRSGGHGVLCEAHFLEGLSDAGVEDLFREVRNRDYTAIAERARKLGAAIRSRARPDDPRRQRILSQLERLKRTFQTVVERDPFGAPARDHAAQLLSLVEDRLQGVESATATATRPIAPPRAATWVTRTGIMVDRIASAWLIRRFIDSGARFKFVNSRGYRPTRGELRFDMEAAEFTHDGDRCTFEVLIDRFHLHDSALKAIAEIVHDLDLEDEKYGRPEAPGVGRMIVGLAIANTGDEARLQQGAVVFENLYESFRTRRR